MDLTEKKLSEEKIFDGVVLHVRRDTIELPNGNKSTREYIKHNGAVCVIPVTDEGEIVLERQYRYPIGRVVTEIPAGKLEIGEDPLEAAKRELYEETGYIPGKMEYIGDYIGSPALLEERVTMYLATELTKGDAHLDEDEFLEVFTMPLEEAYQRVMNNEFADAKTQLCILKAYILLNK
ncbi:MAG: NUDIX hydrolase [Ruminococcaceae bacterium]|nr:NUDIX hydrolase [Oscillospiraceae bacterium]